MKKDERKFRNHLNTLFGVTIPAPIRKELGIEKHDLVEVVVRKVKVE